MARLNQIIIYNGNKYERTRKGTWIKPIGEAVPWIQKELDAEYFKILLENIETLTVDELYDEAVKFKENKSVGKALTLYDLILDRVDIKKRNTMLSEMSRCYREQGQPERSTQLYERAVVNHWYLVPAFLTSVAAAYLDIYENIETNKKHINMAKKLADHAYAMTYGKDNPELKGVYGRLKKLQEGSGKHEPGEGGGSGPIISSPKSSPIDPPKPKEKPENNVDALKREFADFKAKTNELNEKLQKLPLNQLNEVCGKLGKLGMVEDVDGPITVFVDCFYKK